MKFVVSDGNHLAGCRMAPCIPRFADALIDVTDNHQDEAETYRDRENPFDVSHSSSRIIQLCIKYNGAFYKSEDAQKRKGQRRSSFRRQARAHARKAH